MTRGQDHPAWKGDAARPETKRARAQKMYPVLGKCERCKSKDATDRHHVDGNTGNNVRANLQFLCRRCHMDVDGRLDDFMAQAKRPKRLPPRPCKTCGRDATVFWYGECRRCNMYRRRTGVARPPVDHRLPPQPRQKKRPEKKRYRRECAECGVVFFQKTTGRRQMTCGKECATVRLRKQKIEGRRRKRAEVRR